MAKVYRHSHTSRSSKIAIIGGGVSGIAAVKQLRDFNPVVFEGSDSIGGVWKHCAFRSTQLQTPRRDYQFSDYPWPESTTDHNNQYSSEAFPTHLEILDYLDGYCCHFDLFKLIKLRSKVVEVRYCGDKDRVSFSSQGMWGSSGDPFPEEPVWEVGVLENNSGQIQWYKFEFLVVCLGKYGDIPLMPEFAKGKGPEIFKGKVMHTMDYSKLDHEASVELFRGKKVVVVGFKKSALDLATECADANQGVDVAPCTVLIRTLHWMMVPSYKVWGISFLWLYATRAAQFFHRTPSTLSCLPHTLLSFFLSPLRRGISKLVETYLVWKLPLHKYGLKPSHPFSEDYASCQMAIVPEKLFPAADSGRIVFQNSPSWNFWSDGVELEDGTRMETDVVMLATGYEGKKKLDAIIPQPFKQHLLYSSGLLPLYRGTIHPMIPHMAFVGYIESVSNLHTSELRCKWLSRLLHGVFKVPKVEKMVSQVSEEIKVIKRSTRFYKRQCISTFSINHSDEICREMGLESWRKKNLIQEAFSPYSNQDYKDKNHENGVWTNGGSFLTN